MRFTVQYLIVSFLTMLIVFSSQPALSVFVPPTMDSCQDYTANYQSFRFDTSSMSMQYCDGVGSMWQSLIWGGTSGVTCSQQGRQKYQSNTMYFCDGSAWISMDAGVTTSPCGVPGAQILTTGRLPLYCDGTFWHNMTTTSTLRCMDFPSKKHCEYISGCSWSTGCYDMNDCADRLTPSSCSINPQCSWYAGSCGTVY